MIYLWVGNVKFNAQLLRILDQETSLHKVSRSTVLLLVEISKIEWALCLLLRHTFNGVSVGCCCPNAWAPPSVPGWFENHNLPGEGCARWLFGGYVLSSRPFLVISVKETHVRNSVSGRGMNKCTMFRKLKKHEIELPALDGRSRKGWGGSFAAISITLLKAIVHQLFILLPPTIQWSRHKAQPLK